MIVLKQYLITISTKSRFNMKTTINQEIFHAIVEIAEKLQYTTEKTMTYEELASLINKLCVHISSNYDYQKVDPTIRAVCEVIKSCFTDKNGNSLK